MLRRLSCVSDLRIVYNAVSSATSHIVGVSGNNLPTIIDVNQPYMLNQIKVRHNVENGNVVETWENQETRRRNKIVDEASSDIVVYG